MTIFYDPSCLEYSSAGHPERPERIARTAPVLDDRHPDWEWRKPAAATDAQLLRAHSRELVERVANVLEHFDLDTPFYPNIEVHARRSAGAAIEATRSAHRDITPREIALWVSVISATLLSRRSTHWKMVRNGLPFGILMATTGTGPRRL
jgi:acetoin utilization deacetylase AcuC-like enzyme